MSDDTTLSVSRYIAARPETVWTIMTERLSEWWCPRPWRTEINALEWRAGGAFDTTMIGPEAGEESGVKGILLEVTEGKRFVFTDAVDSNWNPQHAFLIGTLEISPEGDGTRYTASARHWSREDCEKHQEMGFEQGWSAVADQLAQLAEE